jgi:hypothetical protein
MGTPRNKKPAAEVKAETAASEMTLDIVKEATRNDSFVYTDPAFHTELLAQGLVEVNPEMTDGDKLATRATFKDENQVTEQNQSATATPAKVKPVFTITDALPEPVKKPRKLGGNAGRDEVYPFSQLEVGKGFFVEGKENKAMASTIASANSRYSEVVEGETRVQTRGKNKGQTVPVTRQLRKFISWDGFAPDNSGTPGVWIKREA